MPTIGSHLYQTYTKAKANKIPVSTEELFLTKEFVSSSIVLLESGTDGSVGWVVDEPDASVGLVVDESEPGTSVGLVVDESESDINYWSFRGDENTFGEL